MSIASGTGAPVSQPPADADVVPPGTPPVATGFHPSNGAVDVSVNTNLIVEFDSPVVLGAGNVVLKNAASNGTVEAWDVVLDAGTGAGQASIEGLAQLTMRLAESIPAGIDCYVIWDAGVVKNASGVDVAAQTSTSLWSFTVAAGAERKTPRQR